MKDQRVELSNERKVKVLSGHDEWHLEAMPELGLPAIMVTDGPHGLRKVESESLVDLAKSVPATCFPTACALGASWDPALVREVGEAIGREARAHQVSVVLGPGVNIKRHPLCGRNFEYYSEDPLLSGVLAAAFINGVQLNGVGTSLKHYAVNNQESNRMVLDAIVDERTLREIYLPAFEIAVARAQPWTVMCAYNKVNGTYCAENHWLLTELLRDEWGFEGLVVTDWGANNDRVAGIKAGQDLEMPGGASVHDATVLAALANRSLPRDDLDTCVERVVQLVRRATGEPPVDARPFDPAESHALARRAASASAVLLQNEGDLLPLAPSAHLAVIGEFAAKPRIQGNGSSGVRPTQLDSPVDELRRIAEPAGGRVVYAAGYDRTADDRPDLIDEAVAVARRADIAVVFVGLPPSWESEGFDRDHLRMPYQHDQLVRAVTAVNPNTVVVLANGAPVVMPWIEEAPAILEAYLGGQAMGGGIADVLYGIAEPGGRLAETFPDRLHDVASDAWFPGEPRQVQYREGLYVGYRWFDSAGSDVLFPFGHGLSYTTFGFADASLSADTIEAGENATVSVEVTNTGTRAGSEVVQVYVRPADSAVYRPDRELRDFAKVHLEPGERTIVQCTLGPRAFSHWDTHSGSWQIIDGAYEVLVGTSSRTIHAALTLKVRSSFVPQADQTHVDPAVDPYRNPKPDNWTVDDAAFARLLGHDIPKPTPVRPFTRNSTLGEVGDTALGRPLLRAVQAVAGRAARGADTEGGLGVMLERALSELPLRNVAAMSQGRISMRAIDRTIRMINAAARRKRP